MQQQGTHNPLPERQGLLHCEYSRKGVSHRAGSPDYWQHAVRVTIIRDCLDNCIGKDRTHVSCIGTRNLPVKLLWSVGAPIQKLLGSFSGAARGTALNLQ
jgi:hypothetical protein